MISPTTTDLNSGQGVIHFSTREVVVRRQLGIKLARRKLLDSAKNLQREHERNGTIWIDNNSSMPPLLFRRRDEVVNRSDENNFQGNIHPLLPSGSPIYKNVTFLNNEVVIASTTNWLIDAIRLPDDGLNLKADCPEFDGPHVENTRQRCGKLIADQLGNPVQGSANPSIKLKSLSNGQSFVAGLPSGYLQIFSTERESTWCRQRFEHDGKLRAAMPQRSEIMYNHGKGDVTFIRMILQIAPPRRRYWRDCTDAKLSLHGLITSWSSAKLSERYGLSEIPEWDLSSSPLHTWNQTCNSGDFNESSWDFRKAGSTLLAAHVNPQKDCFSIHTIDENVRYAKNLGNSPSATCVGDTKPLICLDATSRDNYCKMYEDITGICFVGDWGIATAHTLRAGLRYDSATKEVINLLKFWDRRLIAEKNYHRQRETAVKLISFPDTSTVSLSTAIEQCIVGLRPEQQTSEIVKVSGKLPSRCTHPLPIVGLSAPFGENSNSICVSLHGSKNFQAIEPSYSTEDLLLDAVDPSIKKSIKLMSSVRNTLYHLPAFSTDLNFMARYYCQSLKENNIDTEEEMILLYDLSRATIPASMQVNDYCTDGKKENKRKRNKNAKAASQCMVGDSYGTLPVKLLDEYGLSSGATCFGLNDNGTSVVCGSSDGDLFIY